ncbi:Uncharacterized protein SCF082_LOCUS4773 [Durusdinium trenchii]|uniref:(S)-ureidoglycine aminohydrolase cupin domain-containing protein n=1 Tax=Durusdinium trenchii TaxID=1381693 RepID=A0ABP0I532_9DINO
MLLRNPTRQVGTFMRFKGIKVEKMSKEEADKKFGVSSWPTWGCGVSKFDWDYSGTETAYILEGEATVTPTGEWADVEEAWRQALLSKIVGDDELSGEDLERHEQFLKAKEDALAALATQQDAAQTALQAAVAELPKDQKAASLAPTWISDEEYKELGYPQLDPKFRSNEWQKKQLQLDSTDPRHNPNLNRDQNDPEFWYHAARKPFNKALLRTEQHWNSRREVWLKQFEQVKDLNQKRELLAELLEDTSTEVKRLVAPILHFSITMKVLSGFVEKAADKENNQVYSELHTAVLKNLSQACMKLGLWHEAAKAAETATQLSPEDHKVASQVMNLINHSKVSMSLHATCFCSSGHVPSLSSQSVTLCSS